MKAVISIIMGSTSDMPVMKKAAEFLGMTYHQLRGYLRKYELTETEE